jgi:hypothetical protein
MIRKVAIGVLAGMICSGCAIVPTDYHAPGSRIRINKETQQIITPGKTTKEEVFLMLGEPDIVFSDGDVEYSWTKVKALWVCMSRGDIVGIGYIADAGIGYVETDYGLIIEFDEQNVVSDRECKEHTHSGNFFP